MSDLNTPWRLTATAIYSRPTDARIFGHMDLDVTAVEALIARKQAEGRRLTYTHVVAACVARALAEDATELNSFIRRGRIHPRDDVGVMLAVDAGDGNLAVMVVRQAHTKTLDEIADEITRRAEEKRTKLADGKRDGKNFLARVPWPFRGLVFRILRVLIYDFGLAIGSLSTDTFGSVAITNIGKMGLNTGYTALLPPATCRWCWPWAWWSSVRSYGTARSSSARSCPSPAPSITASSTAVRPAS